MADDLFCSANGCRRIFKTLGQVRNHLVLVLGDWHGLRRLQFRFQLAQVRIILRFLRLHFLFLQAGLLRRFLNNFFESLRFLNLIGHRARLAHLFDERACSLVCESSRLRSYVRRDITAFHHDFYLLI